MRAEMSSLTSSLDDMVDRVTALAEQSATDGSDATANELFEVERALRLALRRLENAQTTLP